MELPCPLLLDWTHHLGVSRARFFRILALLPCPPGKGPDPYLPFLTIPLLLIRPGSHLPSQVILVAYHSLSVLSPFF